MAALSLVIRTSEPLPPGPDRVKKGQPYLTWGNDAPQKVFYHCAEMLWSRTLKLCDFNINPWSIKKVILVP